MRHIILGIWLVFTFNYLNAQVKFTASVNKTNISLNERIKVSFQANSNFSKFTPPSMNGFSVLSGPNQSSSMQWINGEMTSSKSYSYIISPNQIGELTIGKAIIEADGKTYESEPIKITVVNSKQPTQQQQTSNNQAAVKSNNEELFMRLFISNNKPVVGEQVVATYKLYTRIDISGVVDSKEPSSSGFWKEDVKLPDRTTFTKEVVNGKQYNTAIIKQVVLFPQKAGKLTIDPLEVKFRIRIQDNSRPNSLFDQFFGRYVEKDVLIKSDQATIQVSAIPGNKPKEFTGGVGKFNFKAELDKSSIQNNEAINLKLTVNGSGNIKLVGLPDISFPADFEVYDPKSKEKISVSGNGVSGTKSSEYLIIPRHSGDFEIPEINFSYYDTKLNTYKNITQGPFNIHVEKGNGESENNSTYVSKQKEDLKLIGTDIRFIQTKSILKSNSNYFFGTIWHTIGTVSPFICLVLVLILRKQISEATANTIDNRKKKATSIAKKRLKEAHNLLQKEELDAYYETLSDAIYGYFQNKFTINKAEISKELINEKLTSIGVSKEDQNSLSEIIDTCQMARFAPVNKVESKNLYEKALSLIVKIEQAEK